MPMFSVRSDSDRGPSYEGVDVEERVGSSGNAATPSRSQSRSPFSMCTRPCSNISKWGIFYLSLSVLTLIATATYVGLKMTTGNGKSPASPSITWAPTSAPVTPTREQQVQELVLTATSEQVLSNQKSPQYRAFDWILNDDPRHVLGDDPDLLQRYILAILYFSTNNPTRAATTWINAHEWMSLQHECNWFGIDCEEEALITLPAGAAVGQSSFAQQFPDNSLPKHKSKGMITLINLTSNGLHGTLPKEISMLQYLFPENSVHSASLYLGHNHLSGTIPDAWGNLTYIKEIHIEVNNLTGSIPESLANLKNINTLDLSYNNFTGTFPQQVCDELVLESYGDLKGSVPLLDCGCACNQSRGVTGRSSLTAQIRAFSSDANVTSPNPVGSVLLTFNIDGMEIKMNVSGLESSCTSVIENGCGIHIHQGDSCDNSAAVKGHYWNINLLGTEDPWVNITYITNGDGFSGNTVIMPGGNGYSSQGNKGHSIVIHDQNGGKIGCGLLQEPNHSLDSQDTYVSSPKSEQHSANIETNELSAQIDSFPLIESSFNPKGDIIVQFGDEIKMKMNVSGLESTCQSTNTNGCGIHIHEGVSCNSKDQVMGHYWNSSNIGELDPWVNVTYNTNKDGISGGFVDLVGGNGYSIVENVGHAIVIHDENGNKIACGILMKRKKY